MYNRTSMLFKTSSVTILNHEGKTIVECIRMSTLKHELSSTVFYVIKHYFSFFEIKGSDCVIYYLV